MLKSFFVHFCDLIPEDAVFGDSLMQSVGYLVSVVEVCLGFGGGLAGVMRAELFVY